MDVYLSEEAQQHLGAQALEMSKVPTSGLLLGHRRGPRFFVERIYPCPLRPFISIKKFHALNCIFNNKIIGFYASGRRTSKGKPKFPPFAVNKLYLEFEPHPKKGLTFRPTVVEYAGSFQLVPVALAPPARGRI